MAGEVERLGKEEGMRREDIAVFYRTNAMSRVFEDTLVRYEVPYQVIGGTKFYERAEIKDAVAYLSLLVNPADAVSFSADRQLAPARDRRHQPGAARRPREHDRRTSGRWCARSRTSRGWAPRRQVASAVPRHDRQPARRAERGEPVAELLDAARETGYLDALEAERTIEAEGRVENLEELVGGRRRVRHQPRRRGRQRRPPDRRVPRTDLALTDQDGCATTSPWSR